MTDAGLKFYVTPVDGFLDCVAIERVMWQSDLTAILYNSWLYRSNWVGLVEGHIAATFSSVGLVR